MSGTTIEIVDNTWPALQRAEEIFGPRDDAYRGTSPPPRTSPHPTTTSPPAKPKRALR